MGGHGLGEVRDGQRITLFGQLGGDRGDGPVLPVEEPFDGLFLAQSLVVADEVGVIDEAIQRIDERDAVQRRVDELRDGRRLVPCIELGIALEAEGRGAVPQDEAEQFPLARRDNRVLKEDGGGVGGGRNLRRNLFIGSVLRFEIPFAVPLPVALRPLIRKGLFTGPADAVEEDARVDVELGGAVVGIDRTLHRVRYLGDAVGDVVDDPGPLQRVPSGVGEQQVGLEADEILLVPGDEGLHLFQRVFPGEGVGVVAVREENDLDVHPFLQDHVDAPQGGMDAGRVAVVHDGHVFGETLHQADLLDGEGGAAGGDRVQEAELVEGQDVEVALHEIDAVPFGDLILGEVDAVEGTGLDVNLRFLGVYILGDGLVAQQGPPAEGNHAPADRMDREHDPVVETVMERAVVPFGAEARLGQVFGLVAGLAGGFGEGGFALRGPSEAIFLDGLVFQAAGAEVLVADGPAFRGLELVLVEMEGEVGDGQEALVPLPGGDLLGGLFLFLDFDVVFVGEVTEGFRIGEPLIFHQETDGRPGLAAAEALVDAPGGDDVEGGRLLVVEGTAGPIAAALPLEGHEIPHDLLDAGRVDDQVDRFLRDHSFV